MEEVIEELKRVAYAFSAELALEKVTLFGSYAKGRSTVASDIDVFVVFDDSKSSQDQAYKTLMRNIRLPRVELHALSRKDYEAMKGSKWIRTIEAEGVVIFNRRPAASSSWRRP